MSEYKTYPGYKIFPIKNDPACLLKWAWSTINMEYGTSSSCHRVQGNRIDPDNFDNFHNLPEKIKARKDMINGQWPGNGCEYCSKVEAAGRISDRQMTLSRHHGLDKIPPELYVNPLATEVTPTILEIYFNNTCNLSCVYCNSAFSSKWNQELLKFGPVKINDFEIPIHVTNNQRYDKMVQDLWNYLETNDRYKILRHYQLLGGESLLQKELDSSITFWKNHPNPALTFNIISNIMIPHELFVEKILKFQELVESECIYQLELTASLDCWGPQQEYVRYGLDLDVWTKNFEYMLNKSWIKLSVHSCMTALTIKTLPELIEKISNWSKSRPDDSPVDHSFDFVIGKEHKLNGLHPILFGPGVFDKDFEKILKVMPENNESQITAKNQMLGLAQYVKNSSKNSQRIATLKLYLDELDRRRSTNWRTVFPWLDTVN